MKTSDINTKQAVKGAKTSVSWLKAHPIVYTGVKILGMLIALSVAAHILLAVITRHGKSCEVPDFVGILLEDAEHFARKQKLDIVVNDSLYVANVKGGTILDQIPKGGVGVKPGRKVYVTINSKHQKKVPLPYVAGRSLRHAKNMLENAGLEIKELIYQYDMATNYVLEERFNGVKITIGSNMKVEKGSGITLVVGREEGMTATVPALLGTKLPVAKNKLWEAGLNVGTITYDRSVKAANRNDARVCDISLVPGQRTELGQKVNIELSTDTKRIEEAEHIMKARLEQLRSENENLDGENTAEL